MPATLDDVLKAIQDQNDILEEIRDGTGGGSGSGAPGGPKPPGKGKSSLTSMLPPQAQAALAAIKTADGIGKATGINAGLGALGRGASGSQALGVGARRLAQTVTELPFADVFAPNTADNLEATGRAQKSVEDLVSSVAMAGGEVDETGIRSILKRQNELQINAKAARNKVAHIQGQEGAASLQGAAAKDATNMALGGSPIFQLMSSFSELKPVMDEFRQSMEDFLAGTPKAAH